MEKGEKGSQEMYSKLALEIPEAERIYHDEELHEQALIGLLDEDRLQYIGSMVLGLNDAVALSGLITGISATLSMASSEYLSARS